MGWSFRYNTIYLWGRYSTIYGTYGVVFSKFYRIPEENCLDFMARVDYVQNKSLSLEEDLSVFVAHLPVLAMHYDRPGMETT